MMRKSVIFATLLSVMLLAGTSMIPVGMAYSASFESGGLLNTELYSIDLNDADGAEKTTVVTDSFVYIKSGNNYSVSDNVISSGLVLSVVGRDYVNLNVQITGASNAVTSVTLALAGNEYVMNLSGGAANVSIPGTYTGDIPFTMKVQLSSYASNSLDLGYVTFTLSTSSGISTSVQTAKCTLPLKSLIMNDFEKANGETGPSGTLDEGATQVPFHIREDDPINNNPVALISVFEDGNENIVPANSKFNMAFNVPQGYKFCVFVTLQGTLFGGDNDLTLTINGKDYKVVGTMGAEGSAYIASNSGSSTTITILGNPRMPNESNWFSTAGGPLEVMVKGTRNSESHELQLRIIMKPI